MMRRLAFASALLLALPLVAAPTVGASESRLIVGYDPRQEAAAHMAIRAAGGSIEKSSPELGFAVVTTSDPATFSRVVQASGAVQYVETDDPVRLAGAQWNGAQWNGAQWNGAQWNGAQWNGAQWNGAQWNGAQWNGAQWNAAQWTMSQYRNVGTGGWQYDLATSDPGLVWQWGAWAMRTPHAWVTTTGDRAATLCVLDSGVAWDHPDLAPNMWTGPAGEHGYNAIDPSRSPYDDAGHGTHIAGIAAGAVGNAFGIAGVGNARVMAVKVLAADGTGYESDLALGLAWCANQASDVAVMALSATQPGPTMDRALGYASTRDVLLLASAGNEGPCASCVAYPASDPRVLAVAAVDGNLTAAPFSARGPEVDFAAPGVHALGPFPGGLFVFGSGTSQAVAHAAGLAALLRDTDGTLTAAQVAQILSSTARDLGKAGKDPVYGSGLLDAKGALEAVQASARRRPQTPSGA